MFVLCLGCLFVGGAERQPCVSGPAQLLNPCVAEDDSELRLALLLPPRSRVHGATPGSGSARSNPGLTHATNRGSMHPANRTTTQHHTVSPQRKSCDPWPVSKASMVQPLWPILGLGKSHVSKPSAVFKWLQGLIQPLPRSQTSAKQLEYTEGGCLQAD